MKKKKDGGSQGLDKRQYQLTTILEFKKNYEVLGFNLRI